MTDMMKLTPPKFAPGSVDGAALSKAFSTLYREVFARLDVRYPNNDFNAGLVASGTGVTLGSQAIPAGRTVGVPALVNKITNAGTAQDQRFLPQVSAGNKLSIQSVLPLSATSTATTSTINIAAHTLQYGYGTVPYSSGSISGLTPNTNYYVYADDPNYQGGTVSYLATTNPQTVTASNGRYYVGSIVTAVSATVVNISAATSANPIEFTDGTHGFSTGDNVQFASLPGDFGTNLNSITLPIIVTSPTKFTVAVDGTAYTAYTSGGTATRVSTPTSTAGGGAGGGGGNGVRLL
jgi:hypothetical protein